MQITFSVSFVGTLNVENEKNFWGDFWICPSASKVNEALFLGENHPLSQFNGKTLNSLRVPASKPTNQPTCKQMEKQTDMDGNIDILVDVESVSIIKLQ